MAGDTMAGQSADPPQTIAIRPKHQSWLLWEN